MARNSYQVQAEARRVFARHWVDLDRMRFGIYRDTLRATGELHAMNGNPPPGGLSLLEVLTAELLRISEVRSVALQFDNWERGADGRWRERVAQAGAMRSATEPGSDTAEPTSAENEHD